MKPDRLCRALQTILLIVTANGASAATPQNRNAIPGTLPANALEVITVKPSQTDPAIKTFDVPHFVFLDRDIITAHQPGRPADRHELLLWIPGTQPPGAGSEGPGGAKAFCELAAHLGYRVIVLKYPNDKSASVCRGDSDPNAFEDFRMALIAGGKMRHITITRSDSIENRLIKLLRYLEQRHPGDGWNQFLTGDGSIKWEAIAVAGQSQGGGHAALLGIKHQVARVICTGAPKDNSIALRAPAAWLGKESATPKSCFFALNHHQDHQGCSPAEQAVNLRRLGLEAFGAAANVDREAPPYHHARILTTNHPGTKLSSKEAHTSVMNPRLESVFGQAWAYMLTEPALPQMATPKGTAQ